MKKIDPTQLTPEPERPSQERSIGPSTPPSTSKVRIEPPKVAYDQGVDHGFATFKKKQEDRALQLNDGFWTSLNDEFDGMRQLLEDPDSDDDDAAEDSVVESSVKSPSSHFTLSPAGSYLDTSEFDMVQHYPSHEHSDMLAKTFFANVDSVCKTLHRPAALMHLSHAEQMLNPATGRWKFGSFEALTFSMYFAAVTSLSDEECMSLFGQHRGLLVARYRRAAEIAFSQADFLNSMEQLMLQSFVIYLVCHMVLMITDQLI